MSLIATATRLFSAVSLVFLFLVIGCSKRGENSGATEVVRISQRNEPADLDPATASLPDEFFIIRALSEGLLVPNPNGGSPLPAAAERYEMSADGLTYTFHLRTGATWSNGERVTAQDFVASYRRVLTRTTAAPKAHLFYAVKNACAFLTGGIDDFSEVGIQATGPTTLVIKLAAPLPSFPLYVASGPWIPINPRVVAEYGRKWTQPANYVGNGPFTLAEWRQHQRIVVRRNPRYFEAASLRVNEIQFIRFDDKDTEERAFRAGQVDVTMAVPEAKLATYENQRRAELHRAPLAETRFIAFNTEHPPLNDVRVRRALALAINREQLVTHVLRGGQLAAERFVSPSLLPPSPIEQSAQRAASTQTQLADSLQAFNPTAARQLLAEAGFPGGKGFPHLEFSGWDRNPVLEAIQQMWRQELGIEVEIVVHEAKVHLSALNTGAYHIAFVTNLLDVRTPVAALTDFTSGAPNNFPHWFSPKYDGLLASGAARSTTPEGEADLLAAEKLLLDAAAVAPIYFNVQNWLMSPRIHGWEQDALWSRRYNDLSVQ